MNPAIPRVSQALVVASNDTVRDYLVKSLYAVRMGVVSTEDVDECIGKVPAGPSLVVLHPDGFRFDQIVGILFALRRERPDVYAVLVTETPDRYVKLIFTADNAPPPSVVPMPVLARTVLEAVASAAAADAHARMHAASNDGPSALTGSG